MSEQIQYDPIEYNPGATGDTIDGDTIDGEPVVAVGPRSGLSFAHIVPRWGDRLEALELASYPSADPDDLYHAPQLEALANDYPDGCFAGFDGDDLVAMGLGVRVDFDMANPQHTIDDIVPHEPDRSGHNPDGPWYYGTGISVSLDYRRRGIGQELYELRKWVCYTQNLSGIVAGGVMPGYADHKDTMSADDYIAAVTARDLYDPTLTFQLDNGFELGPALAGYITDPAVNDYASLIVWHNPKLTTPHQDTPTGS